MTTSTAPPVIDNNPGLSNDKKIANLRAVLCNEDSQLSLRFRALFGLKHLGTQGSIPAIDAIAAAFSSESALLKHELSYCLGQTKSLHAVRPLQERLQDPKEHSICRHESAEALAAIGHVDSLPILRKYLDDPDETVRQTCELAVDRIEWEMSEEGQKEAKELEKRFVL